MVGPKSGCWFGWDPGEINQQHIDNTLEVLTFSNPFLVNTLT